MGCLCENQHGCAWYYRMSLGSGKVSEILKWNFMYFFRLSPIPGSRASDLLLHHIIMDGLVRVPPVQNSSSQRKVFCFSEWL